MQSLALLAFAATASAHFVLQIPTSIGYDDAREIEPPCGSFNPLDRSKGVTDWPVNGQPISLISTHGNVQWEVNAALISGGASLTWVPLVVPFAQTGVGFVCFEVVPGNPDWVGQEAVVQLIQHAPDGNLHQCAAVRFVAGGPGSVPTECENTAGVSHGPIVAPARPSTSTTAPPPGTTTPTSSTDGPGSSTTSTTQPPPTTTGTTSTTRSTGATTAPSGSSTSSGGHSHGTSTTSGGHSHGNATSTSTKPPVVPTAAAERQLAPIALQIAGAAAAVFAMAMY